MFREIIQLTIERKDITLRKVAINSDCSKLALYQYLRGATTLGLVSIQKIFQYLSLNIVDNTGNFYYYGNDIRQAIRRRLAETSTLIKDFCVSAELTQPCMTAFLQGRSVVRPAKAELMLSALNLSIAPVEIPDRMPRLKVEHKKKSDFEIGNTIKTALEKKGISIYRFCLDNGLNTGGFSKFLLTGTQIGTELFEKILKDLDLKITDGTTNYLDFRSAIKSVMEKKNISAYRICKATDCHPSSLSFYLNGIKSIGIARLYRILDYLDIKIGA